MANHTFSKYAAVFFAVAACLTVVYWPALTGHYAHHDEYQFFINNAGANARFPFFYQELSLGRYLAAFIYSYQQTQVGNVADLNDLRFQTLVNLSLSATVLVGLFEKYFKNILPAFLVVIGMLALPPFQSFVAWGINACKSYALPLSCAAFLLAKDFVLDNDPGSGKAWARVGGAVLLILAALSINQPAAMLYWLFVGVYIFRPADEIAQHKHKTALKFTMVGTASMGLYFILVQLLGKTFGSQTNFTYNPYALTTDFYSKFIWFLREPMIDSLGLWSIYPRGGALVGAGVFLLGAAALRAAKAASSRMESATGHNGIKAFVVNGALFSVLLLLSFAPSLLSQGQPGYYRTRVALSPLVYFLCLKALLVYLSFLSARVYRPLLYLSLVAAAVYGSVAAHSNILKYRIFPSQTELNYVITQVKRPDLYRFKQVHFVRPNQEGYQHIRRYDEFAVPTTHFQQDIPLILKGALREIGLEKMFYHFYPRVTSSPQHPTTVPPETLIVDMNKAGIFKERPGSMPGG